MARKAQDQANQNFNNSQDVLGRAKGISDVAGGRSSQVYDTLFPTLQNEVTNPQGYDPSDIAAMNTAVGQSTGGATAAAVGAGDLEASRTGNKGDYQTSIDDSAREGARLSAQKALEVQGNNADLKQRNRQMGIAGLGSLFGEESGRQLNALNVGNNAIGEGNSAINAGVNAGNSGWFQNLMKLIQTINPGYSKGGGFSAGS